VKDTPITSDKVADRLVYYLFQVTASSAEVSGTTAVARTSAMSGVCEVTETQRTNDKYIEKTFCSESVVRMEGEWPVARGFGSQ
jgi:neutral trehalase